MMRNHKGQAVAQFAVYMMILALLVLAVLAVVGPRLAELLPGILDVPVATSSSHAGERHGSAGEMIRDCINRKGVLSEWVNPHTGRHARVCQADDGKFGIQITEQLQDGTWREVTAFFKNKMGRIDQVFQYLKNAGYLIIH